MPSHPAAPPTLLYEPQTCALGARRAICGRLISEPMSFLPHPLALCRCLTLVIAILSGIRCTFAEGPKLHVFWDTVSPNGKYALAWSTTGAATRDDLPGDPQDPSDNPVSNYLIEIASSKIVLQLSDLHYWHLKDGGAHRYWYETVWSDDNRYLLAQYGFGLTSDLQTNTALLIDSSVPQAADVTRQIETAFSETIAADYGRKYAKLRNSFQFHFALPWFVAPGRFFIAAEAGVPRQEDPYYRYGLYFQIGNGGRRVKLAKAEQSTSAFDESLDRSLNRTYRMLCGLLSSNDQKALADEERTWLAKRDAIKSDAERRALVDARIRELEARANTIIGEKEAD